jgi:hypothetical protein
MTDYMAIFPENVTPLNEARAETSQIPVVAATPFRWLAPQNIAPRSWVYGKHYIAKFVSTTIAPGGIGKSSLSIVEALAIATGRPLLGIAPAFRAKVWLWNGEDPLDELQRRITAAIIHFGIEPEEVVGWLFVDSGRKSEIVIATQTKGGTVIQVPVVDQIIGTIEKNEIEVMIVDPFVASHSVTENDNGAIALVAKTWARIADRTHCSIDLVHHSRKTAGGETTVEDGRGASALLAAARSARVLNQMTPDEAAKAGVEMPRLHFRVHNGKANLAPPEATAWFKLEPTVLPNGETEFDGDSVAVVTPWAWPDPFDDVTVHDLRKAQDLIASGEWAENIQANNWAGKAVAQVLGVDLDEPSEKQKVKTIIRRWIREKVLRVEYQHDARTGRDRPMVVVGEPA